MFCVRMCHLYTFGPPPIAGIVRPADDGLPLPDGVIQLTKYARVESMKDAEVHDSRMSVRKGQTKDAYERLQKCQKVGFGQDDKGNKTLQKAKVSDDEDMGFASALRFFLFCGF